MPKDVGSGGVVATRRNDRWRITPNTAVYLRRNLAGDSCKSARCPRASHRNVSLLQRRVWDGLMNTPQGGPASLPQCANYPPNL